MSGSPLSLNSLLQQYSGASVQPYKKTLLLLLSLFSLISTSLLFLILMGYSYCLQVCRFSEPESMFRQGEYYIFLNLSSRFPIGQKHFRNIILLSNVLQPYWERVTSYCMKKERSRGELWKVSCRNKQTGSAQSEWACILGL